MFFFSGSCYEEIFGGVIVGEEDVGDGVMDKEEESYAMRQGCSLMTII